MGPLLVILALLGQTLAQELPSCASKVFCQGELLHTVQMARIFNDSKSFVDHSLKNSEEVTLQNFDELMAQTNNNPTKADIQQFVSDNFDEGNELEDWIPTDYTESPQILDQIADAEVRGFAQSLVKIWPNLARKVKQQVIDNPELFTILPVPNGFIIPGGRFREFYYWDSYWIIKGLLLSDMKDTVRGMLENFLSIVEQYGFLPNGARIYYLNRSQPPLLTLMVSRYIQATNDTEWLQKNIKTLDQELQYWLDNKVIPVTKDGINYTLAHYDSESGSPRPESYYEDVNTAGNLKKEDQVQLWADLKSGAESGWDFSSRWIIDESGGIDANLSSLHTRRIIPVDLNAFLCQAFRTLAELEVQVKDYERALFWFEKAALWQHNIEQVLYSEEDGIWYDFDSQRQAPRRFFYPSNFAPLWSLAYDQQRADSIGQRAADYVEKLSILDYEGGIPASIARSGEQWDYPNAWPPLQSLVILGLDQTGNCDAKQLARTFADRWITANMIGYNNTGEMFEKYDAENPGSYGGGGEYTVQSGFGWTNGVIFELIERFYTEEQTT